MSYSLPHLAGYMPGHRFLLALQSLCLLHALHLCQTPIETLQSSEGLRNPTLHIWPLKPPDKFLQLQK